MKINEMLFCIRDAAKQQKLVVFIGAGVSRNSGFKTWREFVSEMDQLINISDLSAKCCYSNDDLLKIPQYLYESAPLQYEELITNEYGKEINASNPIIESLLKLKPNHIVTTNFDNLIEFSLDHSNLVDTPIHGDLSRYVKITKDVDFVNAKRNRFFIKMHGDTDNMEQLVLKEEDYLQYSHTHRFIETYIKTLFINHSFLFVGYGIGDYNLKLIMSWVDSITNQSGQGIERTQHFFINPGKNPINVHEKKYYEKRNINILEFSDLPKEIQTSKIEEKWEEIGENLLRCCNYLNQRNLEQREIAHILKKTEAFNELSYISFDDLLGSLEEHYTPLYVKIDSTLYITSEINGPLSSLCKIIQNPKASHELQNRIRKLFLNCGITTVKYALESKHGPTEVRIGEDQIPEITEAFLCNDYAKLRQLLKNKELSKLQHGYILSALGCDECINVYKELYEEAKKGRDFYKQLLLGVNIFHTEICEFTSRNLKDVLPTEFINQYKTLCDYIDGMEIKLAEANRICESILKKYSSYNSMISTEMIQNRGFNSFRTQIFDHVRYMVTNCVDITPPKNRCNMGCYQDIVKKYLSTIFQLISSYPSQKIFDTIESSQPYEVYKLEIMDAYLCINYIESNELSYLIKKNNICQLQPYNQNAFQQFIIKNMTNMFEEISVSMGKSKQWELESQIVRKLVNCFILLNNAKLENNLIVELDKIVKNGFRYLISEFKGENDYIYTKLVDEMLNLLKITNAKNNGQVDMATPQETLGSCFRELLIAQESEQKNLINTLFKSDILIILSQICKEKAILLEDDISILIEILGQRCPQEMCYFLVAAYKISANKAKKRIENYILSNIESLSSKEIYYFVGTKIIDYNIAAGRLMELCEINIRQKKHNDVDNPLYVVARLHEIKLIPDLKPYEKYAQYNNFFSFVCFPEVFDYRDFDIRWYSWLSVNRYRECINEKTKVILKSKFTDRLNMENSEAYKAIYYNIFFDFETEWEPLR